MTRVSINGLTAGLALLALAGCGGEPNPAPPGPSGPMLTARETSGMLVGNTSSGRDRDGNPYAAYFNGDGTVHLKEHEGDYLGRWRISPDGHFCTTFVDLNDGAEQCYAFYRDGINIAFYTPNGRFGGEFAVLAGDPQRL